MFEVKRFRIGERMTQVQLSKASGVPQSVIADIEAGVTKNPTANTMLKIAKALNVTVEQMAQAANSADEAQQ